MQTTLDSKSMPFAAEPRVQLPIMALHYETQNLLDSTDTAPPKPTKESSKNNIPVPRLPVKRLIYLFNPHKLYSLRDAVLSMGSRGVTQEPKPERCPPAVQLHCRYCKDILTADKQASDNSDLDIPDLVPLPERHA